MEEVPFSRIGRVITSETALKMLSRECFHTQLEPTLLKSLFELAFQRLEVTHPQQARNMELFKVYWGFDCQPKNFKQVGSQFELSASRVRFRVYTARNHIFKIIRQEYNNRRKLTPVS